MKKIDIKDGALKKYLEFKLRKKVNEPIYDEDLKDITQLTIKKGLEDLKFFKNLKNVMIKDLEITQKEADIINNLIHVDSICFDGCKFKIKNYIFDLEAKEIELLFCNQLDIKVFENIKNIKKLILKSCDDVNLDGIENLESLEKLYIKTMEISEIKLENLKKLEYLNLNGSKLKDESFVKKLNPCVKLEFKETDLPII